MLKLDELLGERELLTSAQVAREFGYVRETINLAARTGALRAVGKLPARNGAYLFARADVEAWAASSRRRRELRLVERGTE